MALVISDRIKETTNTVGTQTFQLEGAVTGFETFATNLSDGDTTYYAVTDNTNFEVGLGTISKVDFEKIGVCLKADLQNSCAHAVFC